MATRIVKRNDGRTHRTPHSIGKQAAENAIDLETGAILAAEITPANRADSATVIDTLDVAIAAVIDITGEDRMQEAVANKGYCKLETLWDCADRDLETSFSEPKVNGQRRWDDKPDEWMSAFDANHERSRQTTLAPAGRGGRTHLRPPLRNRRLPLVDGTRDEQGDRLLPTASRRAQPEPDPAKTAQNRQATRLFGRAAVRLVVTGDPPHPHQRLLEAATLSNHRSLTPHDLPLEPRWQTPSTTDLVPKHRFFNGLVTRTWKGLR